MLGDAIASKNNDDNTLVANADQPSSHILTTQCSRALSALFALSALSALSALFPLSALSAFASGQL